MRREALRLATREQRTANELRLANQKVVDESLRARTEFQRAEDNLRLAMRAFERIIEGVSHRSFPASMDLELEEETPPPSHPPITKADAELLQSLLKFYVEFAERNGENKAVQLETAKAHHRIGDIRLGLGQFELASAAYKQALNIYNSISSQMGPDLQLVLATVDVLNQRGIALAKTSRIRDAVAAHFDARDLLERQPKSISETRECRFALAQTWNLIGALSPQGDIAGGMLPPPGAARRFGAEGPRGPLRSGAPIWFAENRRSALAILQELLREDPSNAEYRLALARSHRNGLPNSWREHRMQEAADSLSESVRILAQLATEFPDDSRYAFELADALSIDTPQLRATEFGETAEDRLRQAVQIARELNNSSPSQIEYQVLLATAQYRLGMALYRRGELDDAITHLSEATLQFEKLLDQFPAVTIYVASYCRVADDLGTLQRDAGQLLASRETLENAILRMLACSYSDIDLRIVRRSCATFYGNLNRTLSALAQQGEEVTR